MGTEWYYSYFPPPLRLSVRSCGPYAAVDAPEFSFLITSPTEDDGSFRIVTGGTGCDDYTTDLSGQVSVPSTGGWNSFASLTT